MNTRLQLHCWCLALRLLNNIAVRLITGESDEALEGLAIQSIAASNLADRLEKESERERWIPINERIPSESDGLKIIDYGTNEKLVMVRGSAGDGETAHLCRWDADWFRSSVGHKWTHWLPLS